MGLQVHAQRQHFSPNTHQEQQQMPASVTKGQAVHSMQTLRDAFLKLRRGVAPGTGQLQPEFLITLAEVWEEDDSIWECVNNFAMRHVKGTFPPWYYKMCVTLWRQLGCTRQLAKALP